MKFAVLFVVLAVVLLDLEYISAASTRRRRSPSPVPSSTRRRRSPSPVPTSTRRRRTPSVPNYRKTPIYKTTKIKASTYKSPVILSQTRLVSRSSRYPKYIAAGVAAGAVTYYALNYAPVYRGYYPMYGSHLRVPNYRGIRVREERTEIVNRYTNERCYQVTTTQANDKTPSRESTYNEEPTNKELENPVNSTTTVTYENGQVLSSTGSNDIELDENIFNEEFNATTITDYDKDIAGTNIKGNCTRVVTTTRASMIEVYDTNPNANSALILPVTSFLLLVLLAVLSYKFF